MLATLDTCLETNTAYDLDFGLERDRAAPTAIPMATTPRFGHVLKGLRNYPIGDAARRELERRFNRGGE